MKNIIVFGATGLAGSQIVKESLHAGHQVTAFVRGNTYPLLHERLHIIQGNIFRLEDIEPALFGKEAVVVALGNMNFEDSAKVITPALQTIIPSMLKQDIRRILIIAGSGMLNADEHTLRKDLPNPPTFLLYPRQDHFAAFLYTVEQPVEWIFLCPPQIKEGDADHHYTVQASYFPPHMQGFITAGNIGHFVAQELDAAAFIRKRVGIATRS
jgi:putative NADH-flavin reductase